MKIASIYSISPKLGTRSYHENPSEPTTPTTPTAGQDSVKLSMFDVPSELSPKYGLMIK